MQKYIGIDIGGTKIAACLMTEAGEIITSHILATPQTYLELLQNCAWLAKEFMKIAQYGQLPVGVGIAGVLLPSEGKVLASNLPYLNNQNFADDLSLAIGQKVLLANDSNCAALAEAKGGAGVGYNTVLAFIMGTGVGAGLVVSGKLVSGPNDLTGEIGHLPLPFRDETDGPLHDCFCKQKGCIDKSISGPAFVRMYEAVSGQLAEPKQILDLAQRGDALAAQTLDRFYLTIAKALIVPLYAYDPDIIILCGGMSNLPDIANQLQIQILKYSLKPQTNVHLAVAKYGADAGMRGAAWLCQM